MGTLIKPQAAEAAPEQEQYLTFTLGAEVYGLGILCVKEIIEYGHLTVVPMMPEHTRGVINLRGAVVPVVDLSSRFGRVQTAIGRRTCIVIIEVEGEEEQQVVGIIVDAVNEVLEIPRAQIEPPPSFGMRIRPDFINGMAKVEGGFIVLLEIGRVLALDELANIPLLPEGIAEFAA